MWSLESDPALSSTFANITYFDRVPDFERLRTRMWRATRLVPRLQRRVVSGLGPVNPAWEPDPDFDLDHHLRRIHLPKGSTEADVRALATELARTPFDTGRPLWEFTVIEGLPDGRAAMVQKMHHTITDGKGGIRLSVEFIDIERDAPAPPPVDDGPPPPRPGASTPAASGGVSVGGLISALGGETRRGIDSALRLVGSAADVARDGPALATYLASLPAETASTLRSVMRQFAVIGTHRSPLWGRRSTDRALEVFDVPLEPVRQAAAQLGGSINDLFVAAAAGGAGRYHRARGVDVAELRMNMPVSTRTDRVAGGNAFSPSRVLVPVGADPAERFAEIHRRLTVTKTEKALGLTASLAGLGKLLPRAVLVNLARQQVATVDFTTSNVKAAPFDLFIAGARIERNYPLGPVMGTAWNLTTMSYRGLLNLGLHVDRAAVEDPAELAGHIADAFAELIELGTPPPAAPKAAKRAKPKAPRKAR